MSDTVPSESAAHVGVESVAHVLGRAGGKFYWTFDEEDSLDDKIDEASHLRIKVDTADAWYFGLPSFDGDGLYGPAIDFGTGGYIGTAALAPYTPSRKMAYKQGKGFTYWAWVKMTRMGSYAAFCPMFINFYDSSGEHLADIDAGMSGAGMSVFVLGNDLSDLYTSSGIAQAPLLRVFDLWQLLVIKYDPKNNPDQDPNGGGKLSIRMNTDAWNDSPHTIDLKTAARGDLSIFHSGGDYAYSVDEVGLTFRVLSDAELADLYNAGRGKTWPKARNFL